MLGRDRPGTPRSTLKGNADAYRRDTSERAVNACEASRRAKTRRRAPRRAQFIQSNERLVEMALGIYFQHGGFTPEKYADALSRLEAA